MKTPRLITLWIFVCALVGCGPIRADQAFDPEIDDVVDLLSGTFRVRAQHSSKCADVSGVSTANGGIVHQWDCHTADNQKWRAVDLGNGYHNLVAVHSGKCMDVTGISVNDLATIQQWSCGSGSNQQFKLVVAGAGYQLQARHSSKCVEVSEASTANGAGLVQLPCKGLGTTTGNASQRFAFESMGAVTGGLAGVVSESMFNSLFANRSPFYTYTGLTSINIVYPDFANAPDITIRKREAAAFLANVSWESDWLRATKEYNTANYCNYCGGCGCPAGRCNYYGRGPIQLSWDCNYQAAGNSIGQDLVHNPDLVSSNASIAWQTAGWFWNTQRGPGGFGSNAHAAMLASGGSGGFGATIAHINGSQECPSLGGGNTSARDERIKRYKQFCDLLGVTYGNNLSC